MTTTETAKTIRELAGASIFSVCFRKRTTGEMRNMVCRLKVKKGISGEGQRYDSLSKGLLTVYDMQKDGWRSIPLDAIESITIRGTTHNLRSNANEASTNE